MMGPPSLIFGAGGIGDTAESFTFTWTTPESVSDLLGILKELDILELDSAASYPPGNPGHTEILLGEAKAVARGFKVDSKVAVHEGLVLTEELISRSIDESLPRLGAPRVRTLYAHMPDANTPLEVTAAAFDSVWRSGKFETLGLCNYSVKQLEEYFDICDAKGFIKPAVFQGHYNALVRNHEADLIPLLRRHGCSYYAYSPLGGGFLTGKVTFASSPDSSTAESPLYRTRWEGKSEMAYYNRVFDKPIIHEALKKLQSVLDKDNASTNPGSDIHPISLTEASLRWLMHHSALRQENGDGIILGAKRVDQLRSNVDCCRKGPLPDVIIQGMEAMWNDVKGVIDESW